MVLMVVEIAAFVEQSLICVSIRQALGLRRTTSGTNVNALVEVPPEMARL